MDRDAVLGGQDGQRLHERIRGLFGVGVILVAVRLKFQIFYQFELILIFLDVFYVLW